MQHGDLNATEICCIWYDIWKMLFAARMSLIIGLLIIGLEWTGLESFLRSEVCLQGMTA